MSPPTDAASTRQRLLAAAAEIFAEHGFAGASVRDICARAEANVAAVNYHFGGKEQLFAEVLRLPLQRLDATIDGFADPALEPTEALARMYRGMLAPLRQSSPEAAAMRVVARSMSGPDAVRPRGDHAVIQRHHGALCALIRRQGVPEAAVGPVAGALIGMAMHAIKGRMHGNDGPAPRMLESDDDAAIDALIVRLARYATAVVRTEAQP